MKKIFQLYDKWGNENYIGENVTQLQHAQQVSICVHIIIISWNKNDIIVIRERKGSIETIYLEIYCTEG